MVQAIVQKALPHLPRHELLLFDRLLLLLEQKLLLHELLVDKDVAPGHPPLRVCESIAASEHMRGD